MAPVTSKARFRIGWSTWILIVAGLLALMVVTMLRTIERDGLLNRGTAAAEPPGRELSMPVGLPQNGVVVVSHPIATIDHSIGVIPQRFSPDRIVPICTSKLNNTGRLATRCRVSVNRCRLPVSEMLAAQLAINRAHGWLNGAASVIINLRRCISYAVAGAVLALGASAGLLLTRLVRRGEFSWRTVGSEIVSDSATYAYVAGSTRSPSRCSAACLTTMLTGLRDSRRPIR